MHVVGYVRTSTRSQTLSAEAQREAITAWCKANGARLMDVFEDIGVSGDAVISGRPGLWSAMAALGSKRADVLLVPRRDRLARSVVIMAGIERMVREYGGRVESVSDNANPEFALRRQVLGAFADYAKMDPGEVEAVIIIRDLVADGMTLDEIKRALVSVQTGG